MTIHLETLIEIAALIFSILAAVWRINSKINASKQQMLDKISSISERLAVIEEKTTSSREDHDKVVAFETKLDKTREDLQNQWNVIHNLGKDVKEVEQNVDQWGQQISKITRR